MIKCKCDVCFNDIDDIDNAYLASDELKKRCPDVNDICGKSRNRLDDVIFQTRKILSEMVWDAAAKIRDENFTDEDTNSS
jgi:hypothetical protein